MPCFIVKVVVSEFLIAAISEMTERSLGIAELVASLPLPSLPASMWRHFLRHPSYG